MNNQEILTNAPDGATHVENLTDYKKLYYYRRAYKNYSNKYMYDVYQQSNWYQSDKLSGDFQSLADIITIIEQADRIAEIEALCSECADYLDTNKHTNIGSGSKLHRDLRKQAGDL
jgi:hypothetical protein